MQQLEKTSNYTNETFESIKHIDETGTEYWYARELQKILEYNKWENFEKVIRKAKQSCENSNISNLDHFLDVRKMVTIGSGAEKEIKDYKLTRYACYLIAQNGDSRKKSHSSCPNIFCNSNKKTRTYRKRILYANRR